MKSQCPCGNPVSVLLNHHGIPVGLCEACANRTDLNVDRVASAQLAAFCGVKRYTPGIDKYLKGGRKSARNLWALIPEIETPHVVAAYSFAISVVPRIPAEWLPPERWSWLLNISRQMYAAVGRKNAEQGDSGSSGEGV